MKKKFIRDISANTLQVIINQVCGLVIFYLLSIGLDKNSFGEINWTLAVFLNRF
jgi:O-antigen/teichoic acid export membrane protein